jgi:hypothetical protein
MLDGDMQTTTTIDTVAQRISSIIEGAQRAQHDKQTEWHADGKATAHLHTCNQQRDAGGIVYDVYQIHLLQMHACRAAHARASHVPNNNTRNKSAPTKTATE